MNRGITAEDYPKLTAIAPTLARPAEYADFGVPGEEQAQLIGQALGKQAQATELLAEADAEVAAAAAANPEFAGKTFSAVWPRPEGAGWFAWTSIDPRVQLITDLGMTLSPEIEGLGNAKFYNEISAENTPQINADVVVAIDEDQQQSTVLADPLFQSLPAAQGGNVAWVTDPADHRCLRLQLGPEHPVRAGRPGAAAGRRGRRHRRCCGEHQCSGEHHQLTASAEHRAPARVLALGRVSATVGLGRVSATVGFAARLPSLPWSIERCAGQCAS